MTAQVVRLHKDIKPHPAANELLPDVVIYSVLAQMIRALMPPADITAVMDQINDILDESIAAEGYKIRQGTGDQAKRINLSEIDFEALQQKFEAGRKNTATQELRSAVEDKINQLVEKNRTRLDYLDKFQKLIEAYNAGSMNIEQLFEELKHMSSLLNEEEKRAVKNELTEEGLAIFDLLTKPEPKLTDKEEKEVKSVAKRLVEVIEGLGLREGWKARQQVRADIKVNIEKAMDEGLCFL